MSEMNLNKIEKMIYVIRGQKVMLDSDLADLRSQFATSNPLSRWKYKRWTLPLLFTESGIAMLSSVLNSELKNY